MLEVSIESIYYNILTIIFNYHPSIYCINKTHLQTMATLEKLTNYDTNKQTMI